MCSYWNWCQIIFMPQIIYIYIYIYIIYIIIPQIMSLIIIEFIWTCFITWWVNGHYFLQNISFFKTISCMQWLLFTKIKKGSWTGFRCIIFAWFFHKSVPYLILYQLTKFQCHIFFPSRDIKQNVLLSFLNNCWRHKLEDLSWIVL